MFIKIITIILITVALFYGNTLFNGFVHDDIWQIVENQDIRSFANLPRIFSTCIAEEILGTCYNKGFYYRPLQFASYLLTYQVSKDPWFFHLVNLFYTFILSILIFKFIQIFIKGTYYPLLGTLFFLTHPVNSEVINWVGAVPELLMSILTLSMFLLYIKFSGTLKIGYLIASAFVYFLALLSKETSLFALGLIVLYEIIFKSFKKKNYRKYFQVIAFYFVPVALYFLLRIQVLGRIVYEYEGFYSLTFWQQIINGVVLYPQYILKLIWPLPLSNQHSFSVTNSFDLSVIAAFLFLALNISLIYLGVKKKQNIPIFGFSFFLILLLPAILFLNKLGEFVFSERYLFLPSIGFFLIVVWLIKIGIARNKALGSKIFIGVFVIYLGISWFVVLNRNLDWKDNLSSYLSIVRSDPNNKKAYVRLAEIYLDRQDKQTAKNYLSKALTIDPNFQEAYSGQYRLSAARFSKNGLSFLILSDWKIEESENGAIIKNSDGKFTIELEVDKKPGYLSADEYLAQKTQRRTQGTLINQGLALIPNTDKAYVKVWTDNNVSKLQFFIFKKDLMVEMLVWPSDSTYMRDFDEMLRSLEINEATR